MSALKHGTNTILANILYKYLHTKIISIIYKAELSIACALGKLKPVSSISLNTLGLGLEKMCLNITLKPMATATEIEAGIPTFFLVPGIINNNTHIPMMTKTSPAYVIILRNSVNTGVIV